MIFGWLQNVWPHPNPSCISIEWTRSSFRVPVYGQPPLSGSSEYAISSLQGRIDADFLQENVRIRHDCFCQRDGRCDGDTCIGRLWTREVDEERKRIDSMQSNMKPKARGRKMKAGKGYTLMSTVSTTLTENIWVCTKEKVPHYIWDELLDLPLSCSGLYWLSRASQWWQWWLNTLW